MPVAVDSPVAVSSVGTAVLIRNNLSFNTGMVMISASLVQPTYND